MTYWHSETCSKRRNRLPCKKCDIENLELVRAGVMALPGGHYRVMDK